MSSTLSLRLCLNCNFVLTLLITVSEVTSVLITSLGITLLVIFRADTICNYRISFCTFINFSFINHLKEGALCVLFTAFSSTPKTWHHIVVVRMITRSGSTSELRRGTFCPGRKLRHNRYPGSSF